MDDGMLDLAAYLARTRYAGDIAPTAAALAALHLAHAGTIAFENIDVLLGRPIALDLGAIQAKLVGHRRGGYCFEHNLLFAAALRRFGFAVTPLAARVRWRATGARPRTHMLLLVATEEGRRLCDVGFGGEGLLLPVPLGEEQPAPQFAWRYRAVAEDEATWVLQSQRDGAWSDLYAFTLEPQLDVDFAMASHYTATHPESRFVHTLTVQRPGRERRMVLRNRELTEDRGDAVIAQVLDDAALRRTLDETFELALTEDELDALCRRLGAA